MNKETISYVRHIMGSDFVQIDFFNVCLAISIIITSLIAFISGRITLFTAAFSLGAILALFNMIKCFMRKSALGVAVFGALMLVLIGIVVYIYRILV